MPDVVDLPSEIDSIGSLLEGFRADEPAAERARLAARLRERVEQGRAALERQGGHLDALYRQVVQSRADADALDQMAAIASEQERYVAEKLHPRLEALERMLEQHGVLNDPDVLPFFREGLEIGTAWLELYRNHHAKMRRLAAERRAGSGEVLRARPVEGEIDHAKLTREIMARFPNILSELAK